MSGHGGGYDVVVDVDDEGDLGHTDLDDNLHFQDFHHPDVPAGKPANPSSRSGGLFGGEPSSSSGSSKHFLWSISFYQQFFDVNSNDVARRCWAALFPRANFLDVLEGNPDLYGPVWITTTVVMILFLTSTLAAYFSTADGKTFSYNFASLTAAGGLVYGYTAVVPVALWGVLKWYGSESANLLECLALYGYANVIWVPVSIASVSPITILNWVFCAVGLAVSALFLFRNLFPVVNGIDAKTSKVLLIVIVALHTGFALAIKLLFFTHKYGAKGSADEPMDGMPTIEPTATATATLTATPERY